ncbi:hypothetical protein CMU32_12220 [Elizabethkingia anophelis]|nr:hypothetical protein [Elizabethkingia anophelis]
MQRIVFRTTFSITIPMILPSDNLKYDFVEYKGYIIASHKDNRPERNPHNLNIVFKIEDFPLNGYFVGYDDSKLHGPRKMHPNNLEDAKCYVDWIIEVRKKASQNTENQKALKPLEIKETHLTNEEKESNPLTSKKQNLAEKKTKKGRRL